MPLRRPPRPVVAATCAAVLAAAAAPAAAQVQYASRAAWQAAVGGQRFDYAMDGPAGMVTILSSSAGDLATVTTVGGDPFGYRQAYGAGGALGGSSGGAIDNFRPLRFDFLRPTRGFAFDDLDLTADGAMPDEWAFVDVKLVGGGVTRYVLSTTVPFAPQFFGVAAAQGLEWVEVFSNGDDTATGVARANVIDDLAIAVIPEPATVALMGTGLVLLGVAARRRRAVATG